MVDAFIAFRKLLFFRIDELRHGVGKLIHENLALIPTHLLDRLIHPARRRKVHRFAYFFLLTLHQRTNLLHPRILLRVLLRQDNKIGKRLIYGENGAPVKIKIIIIQRQKIAAPAHLDIIGKPRNLIDLLAQGIIMRNIHDLIVHARRQEQCHRG